MKTEQQKVYVVIDNFKSYVHAVFTHKVNAITYVKQMEDVYTHLEIVERILS